MRKIKCDEVLNKSDFRGLTDSDFVKQVIKYCLDKMNEYELSPKKIESLKGYPQKEYEIFQLDLETEGYKIFVLETSLINYDGEEDEKELYYSRIIAKRICDNLKRLHEDAAMKVVEAKSYLIDDIAEIEKQIASLKELDEDEYNLDRFIYNSLFASDIIEEYEEVQNEKLSLEEENKLLKEKIKKSEKTILELSNKLKISLDDIEANRNKLKINNKSVFEKVVEKLKDILG